MEVFSWSAPEINRSEYFPKFRLDEECAFVIHGLQDSYVQRKELSISFWFFAACPIQKFLRQDEDELENVCFSYSHDLGKLSRGRGKIIVSIGGHVVSIGDIHPEDWHFVCLSLLDLRVTLFVDAVNSATMLLPELLRLSDNWRRGRRAEGRQESPCTISELQIKTAALDENACWNAMYPRDSFAVSSPSRLFELVLDPPKACKFPLPLRSHLVPQLSSDSKTLRLQDDIEALAAGELWRWDVRRLPCGALPPSALTGVAQEMLSRAFTPPSMDDELDQVARNGSGSLLRLNKEQLGDVRRKGEYSVPSRQFPNQRHVWRLAGFLQRGQDNTNAAFNKAVGSAASWLMWSSVKASRRILSGFKDMRTGALQVVDLFVGLPHRHPVPNFVSNLRLVHRLAEAFPPPLDPTGGVGQLNGATVQFDGQRIPIDLRLCHPSVAGRASDLLRKHCRGFAATFEAACHQLQLSQQPLADPAAATEAMDALVAQHNAKVFEALLSDQALDKVAPGIGATLVDALKAYMVVQKVVDASAIAERRFESGTMEATKAAHPFLAQDIGWLSDTVQRKMEAYRALHKWSNLKDAIAQLSAQGLLQAAYFLSRDLLFEETVLPMVRVPTEPRRKHTWYLRIWDSAKWPVRELEPERREHSSTTRYTFSKYRETTAHDGMPFWRWWFFFKQTQAWFNNWNHWLVTRGVLCSFRSLFGVRPYFPHKTINTTTGKLETDKSPRAQRNTVVSLLRTLWAHVRHCRAAFEAKPDKGLLGKAAVRWLNMLWNYVAKGAFGSVAIVAVLPLYHLACGVGSAMAVATSVAWVPVVSLAKYIWDLLIYDSFNHEFLRLPFALFVKLLFGVAKIVGNAALLVLLPLLSLLTLAGGGLLWLLRSGWDILLFYLIIVPKARLAATDTWVCRRIHGPGLSFSYFLQVSPDQVVLAAQHALESAELDAYATAARRVIRQPMGDYRTFFDVKLGPVGAVLNTDFPAYKSLEQDGSLLSQRLDRALSDRQSRIKVLIRERGLLRMSAEDLYTVLPQIASLVRHYYTTRIFPMWTESQVDSFWTAHLVTPGLWEAVASNILRSAFSPEFLTPIEAGESSFRLEVDHLHLSSFVTSVFDGQPRDDLDLVHVKTSHTALPSAPPVQPMYYIHSGLDVFGGSSPGRELRHRAYGLTSFHDYPTQLRSPNSYT